MALWIIDASEDPRKAGGLQSATSWRQIPKTGLRPCDRPQGRIFGRHKLRRLTAAAERAMLAVVMSIQLLPADHVAVGLRADLINAAYADYFVPMHLTADSMRSVDDLYDVDLARSVVAYDRGEPVGMALLSRRGERGWVSGVGVLPAWRRRGVGRLMMETLLRARSRGRRQAGDAGGDRAEPRGAGALRWSWVSWSSASCCAGAAPRMRMPCPSPKNDWRRRR